MNNELIPLHLRYRPQTFEEVIGHGSICASLKRMVESQESQSFLFHGPTGTGKTTLSRIAAYEMGADPENLLEIDGASHTQVDAMRRITSTLQYKILGAVKGAKRAIIIDECHRLTIQAWESLLKSVEEPPPHVLWFFCTTRVEKVPTTIKSRCASFTLKALDHKALETLITKVIEDEGIDISGGVFDLIVQQANGSGRQALVNLALVRDLKDDRKEAARVLVALTESDPAKEMAKLCISGGSWVRAMALYKPLAEEEPESVRYAISNYIAGALRNAKTDDEAMRFLSLLESFSESYVSENRVVNVNALLLSIGRALFNG